MSSRERQSRFAHSPCVSGDEAQYHPAPWIYGHLMPSHPTHIWYWMREGIFQLPRSCMEVQFRGLGTTPVKSMICCVWLYEYQCLVNTITQVNSAFRAICDWFPNLGISSTIHLLAASGGKRCRAKPFHRKIKYLFGNCY